MFCGNTGTNTNPVKTTAFSHWAECPACGDIIDITTLDTVGRSTGEDEMLRFPTPSPARHSMTALDYLPAEPGSYYDTEREFHFVVTFNTKTGRWGVDHDTTSLHFEDGVEFQIERGRWVRPGDDDEVYNAACADLNTMLAAYPVKPAPTCKKCGSPLDEGGVYCSDQTCPFETRPQDATYTEG